jgi:hypothetical protein
MIAANASMMRKGFPDVRIGARLSFANDELSTDIVKRALGPLLHEVQPRKNPVLCDPQCHLVGCK